MHRKLKRGIDRERQRGKKGGGRERTDRKKEGDEL